MARRIFRSMVALLVCVILGGTAVVVGCLYRYYEKEYTASLTSEASYIAADVEKEGGEFFESYSREDLRITWIDADGTVLYDTVEDASKMENHADREEVQEALEGADGTSIRYSSTMQEKTIYYAERISDGTVVRVSVSYKSFLKVLAGMIWPIVIVAIIAFALAALFSYRLSRKIVEPINRIDLAHPSEAEAYKELSPLLWRLNLQNEKIEEQVKELKRQQTEFSAITENMSEGFLVVDDGKHLLSYNSSALKLLGVPVSSGKMNVLDVNRSETFQKAVGDALEGKNSEQLMQYNHRTYQLLANPVWQEEKVSGAIIVIMDVTEKEEREALRREFTANVSHELKTPLTSISGTAEIMKNGLVKQEDIPHFAGLIYKEAQRLITLVGDIINLSKLEDSDMSDQKEMTDLDKIVNNVVDSLLIAADKANVEFIVDTEPCRIWGVPSVLSEIVYNLCDNAVKYNKENGKVYVTLKKHDKRVVLSVKDTGIGIPYEDQPRIFERFYRVDKSRSKAVGGTGLGLSIVKHGAAVHHAQIEMDSEYGKGTEMRVIF